MTKKDELEIKKKIVKANTDIAESTSELLKLIFNTLDQRQIHPVVIDVENDPEYLDIIDVPLIEEETKEEKENNVKEEENQVVDLNDEQQQILLLQSTLDNRNMEE